MWRGRSRPRLTAQSNEKIGKTQVRKECNSEPNGIIRTKPIHDFVIPTEGRNLLFAGSISAVGDNGFLDGFAVSE